MPARPTVFIGVTTTSLGSYRQQVALANYNGLLQAMGLAQEEITRQLQDATNTPTARGEPVDAARGLCARLRRSITLSWRQRKE